ncbi:MAG: geranylgeranyl reductase family protein [Acidimicrobiia bacterium]|nr:geranylgeranyl reductase family protein [Acidimicrobiia bacterium]MDH3470378.1 geranylgeranyl reductase family protein [Acidimicrobiia bacterium]
MTSPEILVVGGGPAGTAAAHWLARAGHEVVVAEKKEYPREKTCGDGLTPRAIFELEEMGYDFSAIEFHKTTGLRSYAGDIMLEMEWPTHTKYPSWGGVIRRADLDAQVAMLAEKQGAVIRQGTEARAIADGNGVSSVQLVRNGEIEEVQPRVVVVADGSLSRFGRQLGTNRTKGYPYALALRGYFTSERSTDPYIESHLDVRDADGRSIPGYGWVFPLGDGTINVGVGVLSTFKGWKEINTSDLLDALVDQLPEHWGVDRSSAISEPVGGKLPMAFSVGPKCGRNWLLVGDAAGAVNPFNGEGIDYAYETGRMAASHIGAALEAGDLGLLAAYPQALEDRYGLYHRVARAFVRAIGNPALMRTLVRTGLRSRPLMNGVLRIMANIMDEEDPRVAERTYRMLERLVEVGPRP